MKARNKILVRFINKTGTRAFQKMYQGIRVQKSFNLKHCLPPPYCSRDGLIVKSGREWDVHLRLGAIMEPQLWKDLGDHWIQTWPFALAGCFQGN